MARTAYLSLGSNLGDRVRNIDRALELLEDSSLHVVRRSSLYETEPRDYSEQPWFVNMVAEVETTLFPRLLLARIQRVESALGRQRIIDKGPRTIDIDILLFGRFVMNTPELQVPHPRMGERRFVLEPLAELSPELRHPVSQKTVKEMLPTVSGQKIVKLTF